MARKKNSQAIVVYKAQPSPPKSGAKNKNKNKKRRNTDSDLLSFKAALVAPFSLDAQGARVPDMFSCPTVTRHITRSVTLTSNSNGECDMIVLPSALQHAISPKGSMLGESVWTTGDGLTKTGGQCTTSISTLSSQLTNYRIVGYGVKIIGIQSDQVAAGRLHVATLPVSTWVNSTDFTVGGQTQNRLDPNQSIQATLDALGVQYNGINGGAAVAASSVPAMLNSVEVPVSRLNEVPLGVTPKITSPEAFGFRLTKDSTVGFASVDQTSTSWVTSGDSSYLRIGGHEAVVIALSGCAVSTPIVDVELVYHLEGSPAIMNNSQLLSQDATRTVVDTNGLARVVQQVAALPAFRALVETGGNLILPGLGTLANKFY